jgi:hypothetical protein
VSIINENLVNLDKITVEFDLMHTNGKKIASKYIKELTLPKNNNTLFKVTFPRTIKMQEDRYFIRARVIHNRPYDR